jgi:hypothetical protein
VQGPSLQDRAEIEDLYARYMWALDTGDSEGFAACFTSDALVHEVQPDGAVSSHRALSFVEDGYHADPHFQGHQHRHDNVVFHPDPEGREDHWQVRAYVFSTYAQRNPPGATEHPPATVTWSGFYIDTVAKVDGAWRYVERNIAPWTGEVARAGDRAPT